MTTTERPQKISVYGAGSWGTALALQLARNGIDVLLWDFNPEHIAAYDKARENTGYLPGIPFPDNLKCSDSIDDPYPNKVGRPCVFYPESTWIRG